MKTLVLGGRGAVGRATIAALEARDIETIAAGRTIPAGTGIAIDIRSAAGRGRLALVARDVDVVVNASGIEDARLVAAAAGTPFVDISATGSYLSDLRDAAGDATVVLGAGIAPGVSTLLAAGLDSSAGDEIDVFVMLGTGETHGPAAVAWTAGLAGTDIHRPAEGGRVRNLRERRRSVAAGRRRRHLRADFPDHVLLADTGVLVRSYLALSSGVGTAGLAVVGAVPAWRRVLAAAPHWGDARWEVTAENRRTGERLSAAGVGQSLATGEFAALAAIHAAAAPGRGAVTMADIADTDLLHDARTVESTTARPLADAVRPGAD